MKTITNTSVLSSWPTLLCTMAVTLLGWMEVIPNAHGQGTITFDQVQFGSFYQNYDEQGFNFQVVPGVPYDPPPAMAGQSYLAFSTSLSGYYISLSPTDGGTFGLSSVDLHGTYNNGTSVQFNGYFEDGSMVSTTFSVSYDFQWKMYQFGSQFSSGLVRVDIPNNPWAMDNLVFVPEPSTYALLGLGLAVLAFRKFNQRRKM